MKFLVCYLFVSFFLTLTQAAPLAARYLKFEQYFNYYNGNGPSRIDLYEIEVWSGGNNVARSSLVTANSIMPGSNTSVINDGNFNSYFVSNENNPGPMSNSMPHWIQIDFGSVKVVERIKIFQHLLIKCGLFISSDGINWTQCGRYDQVDGIIDCDPSAPVVNIESAVMRPGTTLMDVVYRVNDPDDATVKTRALAFKDGVRSFANVIKPVTFVEGTSAKLGDAIPTNVNHTLTWNVAADWNIDLGQVKFEVLAMDGRGLLPFDWITVPAVEGKTEITISRDSHTDDQLRNCFFWLYSDGQTSLSLTNGILSGNSNSGVFNQVALVNAEIIQPYAAPFIYKQMNFDMEDAYKVNRNTRANLLNQNKWHAAQRSYSGTSMVYAFGDNYYGQSTVPSGLNDVIAISAGSIRSHALTRSGRVAYFQAGAAEAVFAYVNDGSDHAPENFITDVTSIAESDDKTIALKSNGTIVGWTYNFEPDSTIPVALNGVIAISGGYSHFLALKNDGTVVGWGNNDSGQVTIPAGLSEVTAIAAGGYHSLALKSNGTVVGWGSNNYGQCAIPTGLSNVIAVSAGEFHSLALKRDGTVVGWGANSYGQRIIPTGLSGVTAIAAGGMHSLALKSDGTVVGWGANSRGQRNIPFGLSGVTAIAAGYQHSLLLKAKAP